MILIFVKVEFTPVSKKKENKGRSKSSTASPHGEPELEKAHSEIIVASECREDNLLQRAAK